MIIKQYQNLSSGSWRMNGRNSSLDFVGRDKPSSAQKTTEIKQQFVKHDKFTKHYHFLNFNAKIH